MRRSRCRCHTDCPRCSGRRRFISASMEDTTLQAARSDMRVVVFLDLDDTLFQTLPKCPEGGGFAPATHDSSGRPASFMTPRQESLLHLLRGATIIPTTARNLAAFRNVLVPFDSFAILDFGGVILLPD